MKLDKKQIPQLVVLGLLTLLCIGYVSFTVARGSKTPQPAQSAQKSADDSKSSADTSEPGTDIVLTRAQSGGSEPQSRRDPFVPQKLYGSETTGPAQVSTPQISQQTRSHVQIVRNPSASVPPINPFKGFSQMESPLPVAAAKSVQTVQQEPDPQLVITGVIRGEKDVAIIRSGESGRHIVREGQLIDGRYKVISISDDGAVLVYKKYRIHLKLGGAKNAS